MQYLLSKEDLKVQFTVPDFVIKTQQQIAKDFAIISYRFDDSFVEEERSYEDILDVVTSQVIEIMKLGETTLLQLLYQIDIPQSLFLDATTKPDFASIISEMIIQREAYKVFLREKFK